MTNKEAIETIKIAIAEVEWEYPMDYSVAFDKAIEALEEVDKMAYNTGFRDGVLKRDEEWIKKQIKQKEELLELAEFYSMKIPTETGILKLVPLYEVKYIADSIFGTDEEDKGENNEMEIGNLLFGNSRGEYRVPREWQDKFWELIEAYNPGDGYGYAPDGSPFATDRGGYENDTFLINPYYWGDDETIEAEPNFVYKPTGYEIQWYKYPLRDAWSNRQMEYEDFCKIISECIESVVRENPADEGEIK